MTTDLSAAPAMSAAPAAPGPVEGIVPPLSTPLADDGTIDLASLDRLVRHVLDGGVDGLFAMGSTAEAVYLTSEMRRVTLDRVFAQVAGQVPLAVGCIAPSTWPVIELAEDARARGAAAIVVTAPFYGRTHPREIEDHFRAIHAAVDIPILAYDVPSTHTRLSTDTIATLAREGVIEGLKDSSGDDATMRRTLLATVGTGLTVLTGSELTVDAALLMGAHGAVPGLGNVDPSGYVRLLAAARAGDWAGAKREQDRLALLMEIAFVGDSGRMGGGSAGMSGFKTALHLLGVIADPRVSTPLRGLDRAEVERVRGILVRAELL